MFKNLYTKSLINLNLSFLQLHNVKYLMDIQIYLGLYNQMERYKCFILVSMRIISKF